MGRLPLVARFYVLTVMIVGAVLFAMRLPLIRVDQSVVFVVLICASLASTALRVHIPLPGGESTLSLSYAVDFASLLLLGPDATMVVAATSVFMQSELNRRTSAHLYRTLFSMASVVITVQVSGIALSSLRTLLPPGSESVLFVLLLMAAATVYFLTSTWLVATAAALSSRESILKTWQVNFLWSAPSFFISATIAAAAARFVGHVGVWLIPVAFVPLYLTYRSYKVYFGRIEDEQRQSKQHAELHLATVEALARAIDARDQPSSSHLQRVQLYATSLATALDLTEAEIQAIKTASLLHDIGKLAVPEHILSKPGRLTEEEFQRVRIHPVVGAEIVAEVPFSALVAPAILGHHERWDGNGYPHGLSGEDIPLGARILAVVDYFEAITAERPYHRPLPVDRALELIKSEAGLALDPRIVKTFVDLVPSLLEEDALLCERAALVPRAIPNPLQDAMTVTTSARTTQNVYEHIAIAHREINTLYEIAQAMSAGLGIAETMEIISSKLTKIVPWSGCALFLYDRDTQSLRCAFASGLDAVRLANSHLAVDAGLCGWVARNRRTLINANPAITFLAAGFEGTILKSAIVCPLVSHDTLIGTLSLFHVEPERYSDEHRRLLERVADQAGTVLYNSMIFERTQEDALTDALTSLPNRRSMSAHFARELARAERSGTEFAVVIIDLDGFKAINDTHGHPVGDWALREVATTLGSQLRSYDLCGRYAGDEFILVLTDCGREAAELRRREVQQRIGQIELQLGSGRTLQLRVSAGAAVFPYDGSTYEKLVATADRRMYRDKTSRAAAAMAGTQPMLTGGLASPPGV